MPLMEIHIEWTSKSLKILFFLPSFINDPYITKTTKKVKMKQRNFKVTEENFAVCEKKIEDKL